MDSRAAITGCIDHALRENGLPTRSRELLECFIGPPLSGVFCELTGCAENDPVVRACIAAYRSKYALDSIQKTTVVDGISDALDELRSRHRLAIATSKSLAFAEPLVGALGLRPYFSTVVGPGIDDQGSDKAAIIEEALTALGHPGRAVMVGDRLHDVLGAHENGIPCIGVGWGIGGEDELREAGADRFIGGPEELVGAVEAILA